VASDRYVEQMTDEYKTTMSSNKTKLSERDQLTVVGFSLLILMMILIAFGG